MHKQSDKCLFSSPETCFYLVAFDRGPNNVVTVLCCHADGRQNVDGIKLFASRRLTRLTFCTVAHVCNYDMKIGSAQFWHHQQTAETLNVNLWHFCNKLHNDRQFQNLFFSQRGPVENLLVSLCSSIMKSNTCSFSYCSFMLLENHHFLIFKDCKKKRKKTLACVFVPGPVCFFYSASLM